MLAVVAAQRTAPRSDLPDGRGASGFLLPALSDAMDVCRASLSLGPCGRCPWRPITLYVGGGCHEVFGWMEMAIDQRMSRMQRPPT